MSGLNGCCLKMSYEVRYRMRIYKYQLGPIHSGMYLMDGNLIVEMPYGAKILTMQLQCGEPCVWALVDPEEERIQKRAFRIFGTGWDIPESPAMEYVGTYQELGGALVWHVFEGLSVAS